MPSTKEYNNIFKTTFLFGFVQVLNILVKVGLNKSVAILLGPKGMGIISLFQSSIQMIVTGAGLGISQSAVRDLSDARGSKDVSRINFTVSLVKRIIRYTSLLGVFIMIAISPLLSKWSFGNYNYTIAYGLLSLAVGATIQTDGFKALNTGMRQLRNVAYSTIWGSVAGLVSAIPLYLLFGENGIVPSLIISAFATLIISKHFANKISYTKIHLSVGETLKSSSNMLKMGVSLMLMSFMLATVQLVVSSYVSTHGGAEIVGLYQAGASITTSYFGLVISAMSTEYYPRISSFHSDNIKIKDAVNAQSETGLILALPLVVIFNLLLPFFLDILYSDKFYEAEQYIQFSIIGTICIICSNCMGMVLLAKQNSKIYLTSILLICLFNICSNILLYHFFSLRGLGIAYGINGILQFIIYDLIMKKKYDIYFNRSVFLILMFTITCCILSAFLRNIYGVWIKWTFGSILLVISTLVSLILLKKRMGVTIFEIIRKRIKK